jgi:hypothetical protein
MRGFRAVCAAGSLLAAAALVSTTSIASAASGPAPASFTVGGGPTAALTLAPGQATSTSFDVANGLDVAADFTVDVTGLHFQGEAPQFNGSPSAGLTVRATPSRLSLGPHASGTVRVDLQAAADAKPGGLYAGVVFKLVPTASRSDGAVIVAAQARPLIGHVPGPVDDNGKIVSLAIAPGARAGGEMKFLLTFLDTGSIDYQTHVVVDLVRPDGTSETVEAPPSLVLPGNERAIAVTFAGKHAAGRYVATANVTWGVDAQRHGSKRLGVQLADGDRPTTNAGAPAGTDIRVITRPKPGHVWETGVKVLSLVLLLLALALLAESQRQRRRRMAAGPPV